MTISTERRGDVLVVTMTDHERRNALSVQLVADTIKAIQESRVEGVRAIVLMSASTVFSAGADLAAMNKESSNNRTAPPGSPFELFEALTKETRPVIAAVNGGAYGGGFELTLCCDAIVASSKAFFVLPELGHGVLPNTALARLPALIGVARAKALAFTRRKLSANEAQQMGLVHVVIEPEGLEDAAVALADSIVASAPPTGIAAAKAEFERWIGVDWTWARSGRSRSNPEERKEGTTAFLEKRAPDYERFWRAQ
ncbi:Carnitinyl-CoA dehydratase [Variovorax sp. PBL-H6]|uniref:enoyl-CoA hydratase/isomerase family protein n=1 Tax=Variovorax sp. PBL-H6 TaxID=434009 RepID=UPI0013181C67|nr:enoyl-CoA hydratase/isomerase family protein [Variovorax sp. PBL-H6]VTU33552.1 Carnitinyl-CoA dehydratase [Variovorax sp. PBL-H6]